jgi:hypothetical protein
MDLRGMSLGQLVTSMNEFHRRSSEPQPAGLSAESPAGSFDADAAVARYLAKKATAPSAGAPPPKRGFGRKGL